jgi:hypothetical protein
MQLLLDNRSLFITKRAYHTFTGYAYAQIKKARGQNKMVYNPQPETAPTREDFCWIVPMTWASSEMPARPVPLPQSGVDISQCHAAALEHTNNVFRLYHYGDLSKGVFRGDDTLVCESIPQDDDRDRFLCLMIYNKDAYEFAVKDWHRYWDWKKNRNEARWVGQESGERDYDQKNMMHCMRLVLSGENVLTNGEPIVRFEGAQLQLLRDIRAGRLKYEEVMAEVEAKMAALAVIKESSLIRNSPDIQAIDDLYHAMISA